MAALSTSLDTTAVTERIPTELIGAFVDGYEYTAPAGQAICRARPGKGSIAVRFGRWDQLDGGSGVPAGTKTETDVLTDVTLATSESSITPGIVGFRLPISDEAVEMVEHSNEVPAEALAECLRALNDRIDSDILSGSTSATNIAGAATDIFTAAKFRSASATYRALKLPPAAMGHAFVGHFDHFRDLEESVGSTSAPFTASAAAESLFGAPGASAYRGDYMGFRMFETGNTPVDGAGWSGCMTPIGAGSGLGCVMVKSPEIKMTRGDDAEVRKVTYFNVSAWYGAGLVNPSRILEVLGRT